jgi:hypothetical protein
VNCCFVKMRAQRGTYHSINFRCYTMLFTDAIRCSLDFPRVNKLEKKFPSDEDDDSFSWLCLLPFLSSMHQSSTFISSMQYCSESCAVTNGNVILFTFAFAATVRVAVFAPPLAFVLEFPLAFHLHVLSILPHFLST